MDSDMENWAENGSSLDDDEAPSAADDESPPAGLSGQDSLPWVPIVEKAPSSRVEAFLQTLDAPISFTTALRELPWADLVAMHTKGRLTLLTGLKSLGVQRLPDRQRIANGLARALTSREQVADASIYGKRRVAPVVEKQSLRVEQSLRLHQQEQLCTCLADSPPARELTDRLVQQIVDDIAGEMGDRISTRMRWCYAARNMPYGSLQEVALDPNSLPYMTCCTVHIMTCSGPVCSGLATGAQTKSQPSVRRAGVTNVADTSASGRYVSSRICRHTYHRLSPLVSRHSLPLLC